MALRDTSMRVARRIPTIADVSVSGDARGTPAVVTGSFGSILEDLAREAGGRIIDSAERRFGGGSTGDSGADGPFSPCPDGSVMVAGQCRRLDFGAALPGGDPFIQSSDPFGAAVMGAFGIPAIQPAIVGERNGRPIRSCPGGAVLGKDNLCYMKGSIPRQFRKWKPAPRPVFSAADAKAMRRIGTLQKKVKKLAGDAGMSCKKR